MAPVNPFDESFARVVGVEGRFSDDPDDRGGATCWGITERVARAHGYAGDMRDLPLETARRIYREDYWDPLRLDDIAALSTLLSHELFDTSVNLPYGSAAKFLQRALNVLNDRGSWYADIAVDGRIGRLTLAALGDFLRHRRDAGLTVLLRALNAQQAMHYIELSEKVPSDEKFVYGWLLNRVT